MRNLGLLSFVLVNKRPKMESNNAWERFINFPWMWPIVLMVAGFLLGYFGPLIIVGWFGGPMLAVPIFGLFGFMIGIIAALHPKRLLWVLPAMVIIFAFFIWKMMQSRISAF